MTEAVTLETVARVAGVSVATASRVLNGSLRVPRQELCDRVLAAAKALNYEPNANAQAIARGATAVLGLIVHNIRDPYFSSIAAGVMRAADSQGLMVSLTDTQGQLEREAAYMAAMRRQRARAVIVAGSRSSEPGAHGRLATEIEAFSAQGGRVTLIGQPAFGTDTVAIGNTAGACELAVTLVGLGYQRFAILAGPSLLRTAADRVAGFRDGLASRGLAVDPQDILAGAFTRDGGYEAMTTLLPRVSPGLCVFAVNDVMAVGAIAALRDAGLSVPADLAIAGFDDIETLRDISPGLTTVHLPLEQIGAMAVELIDGKSGDGPRIKHVTGQVIVRPSTPQIIG
jgi:LacI family transcriptional regulator